MVTGKINKGLGIDLTTEAGTRIIIEEEETTTIEVVIEITDPIIGIIVHPMIETFTEMVVGTIIDQIIEGMTVEIEEIEVAQEIVPNPEVVVGLKTEMRVGDRVEVIPEIETDLNQDQDHLLM